MDSVHEHIRGTAPVARRASVRRPGTICAFHCLFRTSMSDFECGGLHLAAYEGELHVFLDEEREEQAGQARLFVLNAEGAERDGESLFNLLDMRAETAAFIPLLGEEDTQLAPEVCEILDEKVSANRNMLLLDRLEIEPAFRGQQLGLKYAAAAIRRFGLGCRLAAARPLPSPQAGRPGSRQRAARAVLRRYFARAGFVPLPGSDLMILDLLKKPRPQPWEAAPVLSACGSPRC